jgi:hypothetical protein
MLIQDLYNFAQMSGTTVANSGLRHGARILASSPVEIQYNLPQRIFHLGQLKVQLLCQMEGSISFEVIFTGLLLLYQSFFFF